MKKAIIHQHYWPEDEHEKNNEKHRLVLYVFTNEPKEEQDRIFDVWTKAVHQAKNNMVEAANILKQIGVFQSQDISLFKDDVFIDDVSDDTIQNTAECKHIIGLANMYPAELARAIFYSVK